VSDTINNKWLVELNALNTKFSRMDQIIFKEKHSRKNRKNPTEDEYFQAIEDVFVNLLRDVVYNPKGELDTCSIQH